MWGPERVLVLDTEGCQDPTLVESILREARLKYPARILLLLSVSSRNSLCHINTHRMSKTSTPVAAAESRNDIVQILVKHEACLDENFEKCTALSIEAEFSPVDKVKFLLSEGVDLSTIRPQRGTPLHQVAACGLEEAVQRWIDNNVDVSAKPKADFAHLRILSLEELVYVTKPPLERTIEVNTTESYEYAPQILAFFKDHTETTKVLVNHDADITAEGQNKFTALHIASEEGHVEMAKLLLENKAAVKETSSENWCALHLAALRGHQNVYLLLLRSTTLYFTPKRVT